VCPTDLSLDADNLVNRLAGPDGPSHFNAHIREQRTAHFPSILNETEIGSLFTPATLGELLENSPALADSTDVFTGQHLVRLRDILHKSSCEPVEIVTQQLISGATVRCRNLELHTPTLRGVGLAVARAFGGAASINAYLTPPGKKGFPPHFDNTDVFIVQLFGTKQWTLYEDYMNQQSLPLRDTPWDPQRYSPTGVGRSFTLAPGCVVYIPRGCMHAAECLEDVSLHLTISLDPRTVFDTMRTLLEKWADQDIGARQRLPDDPDEAMRNLRKFSENFANWLATEDVIPTDQHEFKTGDGARRLSQVIENLGR